MSVSSLGSDNGTVPLAPPYQDDPAPADHAVQFYGDDAYLVDGVARFLGAALAAGDAAVVIATVGHRDGFADRLRGMGVDVALAADQGRYVALDAVETMTAYAPDGRLDATRFAAEVGGTIARAAAAATARPRRVAVFGELVAVLSAAGRHETAIQLEALWNDLTRAHPISLLCAYPMDVFGRGEDGEPFDRICAAHARVIPAESYTALTSDADRLRAISLWQQKAHALEREIEERKRAQQALRERNRELSRAVTARDEFLSVAAHELKSPVTSLRAFAQLLLRDLRRQREIAPERLEAALAALEGQTEKLTRLVGRLLDTAQIEAGELRIAPTSTDLAAIVRSTVARRPADQAVAVHGPERLEATVDPARFAQVVANLVDNAVRFSPDGGAVTVELARTDDGGVRLCVADRGVGVPPARREAVLDRAHPTPGAGHRSGLGLGLAIAREIVALHGGSLRVEAPEPRGTRVVVELPAAVAARGGTAA